MGIATSSGESHRVSRPRLVLIRLASPRSDPSLTIPRTRRLLELYHLAGSFVSRPNLRFTSSITIQKRVPGKSVSLSLPPSSFLDATKLLSTRLFSPRRREPDPDLDQFQSTLRRKVIYFRSQPEMAELPGRSKLRVSRVSSSIPLVRDDLSSLFLRRSPENISSRALTTLS